MDQNNVGMRGNYETMTLTNNFLKEETGPLDDEIKTS